MEDNLKKGKEIIEKIIYITIATVSKEGHPWVSPVYSAYDENYNFFWVSARESRHSQNILASGEVAIVIYNSTVPEGTGEGVYMEAVAKELEDEAEIARAIAYLYDRKNKPHRKAAEFMGSGPRRVYKAVPQKVWFKGSAKVGESYDARVEIKLF